MIKIDKRRGVKPSAELAKQVTKLLKQKTCREASVACGIDYLTLKKVEKRENVMSHKIAQLEVFFNPEKQSANA